MTQDDYILEVYNNTKLKYQMIEAFPFLKNTIPKCSNCDKEACFLVKFKYDDSCSKCYEHITESEEVFVCNLNCDGLYYDINYGEYIKKPNKNNNYNVVAELLCEKDDCFYCGKRVMYNVTCSGHQLQKLPLVGSELEQNIILFVENNQELFNDSPVKRSEMVRKYKKYFNIQEVNNSKLNQEFHKVFRSHKKNYTGYRCNS